MGPGDLEEILSCLDLPTDPHLIMGMETGSDCAVWRLNDETALVQSVDFFTPVVDDPFHFGQIAAANSLSDLYAVGARPVLAMNVVCFPVKSRGHGELKEILRGGLEKIKEAGAILAGGHSVEDPEPKYGLSVTGIAHPDRLVTNKGAKPGDRLIITKPLGTGILATAHKAGMLTSEEVREMVSVMATLNRDASATMVELGAHGSTDVTGFGLAGHALEMARASGATLVVKAGSLPVLGRSLELATMGLIPEGDYANRKFCKASITIDPKTPSELKELIFDAQTSGGLLVAMPKERAEEFVSRMHALGHGHTRAIGWVEEGRPRVVILP